MAYESVAAMVVRALRERRAHLAETVAAAEVQLEAAKADLKQLDVEIEAELKKEK